MKLSEICNLIIDCEHKTAPLVESSQFISIRTPNIGKGYFILDGVNRVSEDTFLKWTKRALPQPGDLIIAREAPVGNVAVIPDELKICLGQRTVLIRPSITKVNPNYLCYLLLSDTLQSQLNGQSTGATVAHLNMFDIRRLRLPSLPSLDYQNQVANLILGYDDLIENNNKRIAILEQMAEQIYREWFVRMRFPGYENTEFEKGVPKGWEIIPIGKVLSFYIGGGWGELNQTAIFPEPGYVIRGTDIPVVSKGIPNLEILRYHKPSNIKSRKLRPFDIVFEVSGGSKDQWLGRNFMVTKELLESYKGNVICASFCKLIRPEQTKISPYYIDQFLKIYYNTGLVSTFQVQSTGISNYQFEDFAKYQPILLPNKDLLDKFAGLMAPIYSEINLIGRQQVILKKTRDLLLPRLISGKLRVKELEKIPDT